MSIVLQNLVKRFGSQRVVDGVSLEVADGELFVLLGASGSGKSTILRMIAGLLLPDSGRILLHGRDVTLLAPQPRGTGFVFQNYSLFRHMTVAENIEFGLRIRKMPKSDRQKRCEELLDLVSLSGLGERYPTQLSGGQQQRVALARALAYEPSVLLLDEPLGALDVKIRAQLRRSLKQVQRRLGVTTVLVTHDQEEAFELADRIGVIDRGVLVELGNPEQLYAKPKSLFGAGFLGAGTVLVGRTVEGQAHFGSLSLPIPTEVPHEEGASAELLFRPEQVSLTTEAPQENQPQLGKGTIIEETFAGPLRRLRLRLARRPGTRQVSPVPPFGEEGLIVDAIVPASRPLPGKELFVSLQGWTILEQSPPRLLAVTSTTMSPASLDLARLLSERMRSAVNVMGFSGEGESADDVKRVLNERLQKAGLKHAELHVRSGKFNEQLATEYAGSLFEMVILPARFEEKRRRRVERIVAAAVEHPEIPILVAKICPLDIRRILICTRAGEPGKNDVRIGGRLARRLGAKVTLLYVTCGDAPASSIARSHLEKASATLNNLEVSNEIHFRAAATPAEGIVAAACGHDLIVVGGHGASRRAFFRRDDVTMQVLLRAEIPILVVPSEEV